MVLPPPRSQEAEAAGLGLLPPPPICAKPVVVNRTASSAGRAIRFCMDSPLECFAKDVRRIETGYVSRRTIIPHSPQRVQSRHAGIRRKAGRTGTLRDHDGRAARA